MNTRELVSRIEATRNGPNSGFGAAWVSPKHKYLCMPIGKVACTTIKVTLFQLETGHALEATDVHIINEDGRRAHVPSLLDFSPDEIVEILTDPGWFRFCFVRNPYFRLFSAYKSKIGRAHPSDYECLAQDIRKAYGYPICEGKHAAIVSFSDFVRYIQNATNWVQTDPHWYMQTKMLMTDIINYDIIGRFETFADDFVRILRQVGAPDDIVTCGTLVRGSTAQICHAAAYYRELADSVYEMYETDFENFGYDRNSWMFDGFEYG